MEVLRKYSTSWYFFSSSLGGSETMHQYIHIWSPRELKFRFTQNWLIFFYLLSLAVVIFATSAILDLQRFYTTSGDEIAQQFPVADSVSDITWAVLGVSIAFFVLRIIIVSLRFKYRPLHSNRKVYWVKIAHTQTIAIDWMFVEFLRLWLFHSDSFLLTIWPETLSIFRHT